jgi:pimeloyl-ACP methyl ester carboxylesterase
MKRCCLLLLLCLAVTQLAVAQNAPPALDALRGRLQSLEARTAQNEIPADPRNRALLKLNLEQARLWLQNVDSNEAPSILSSPYDETKTKVEQALDRAERVAAAHGEVTYSPMPQMHERAYIAHSDGSAQPYWVFLPRDYSPQRKWPLVVFLHGYDPLISKIEPWIPSEATWSLFTSRGFILAVPYGRRNTDFVNVGEDDTLAVTDAVSTRYSVDRERTFLMGVSMGGYGVYAVGLHHPDKFAALTLMCGRTDMYLWFHLNRDEVPAWKQIFYDGDGPRQLIANAFQLPLFFQHGSDDQIVSVENSRRLAADVQRLHLPASYREIPGGSHYIYWDDGNYELALDWLEKQRRAPAPPRVEYSTGSLRNNRAYWVAIEGFEKYDHLAHIDAQIKAGNIIEVSTDNVSRFTLQPPPEYLAAGKPVTLVVNGVEQAATYDAAQPMRWPLVQTSTLHKTPQRCGPIRDCYRDPFLVVYGTQQPNSDDESNARRFVKEWELYADGRPPIKADKDVTEDDKKNYNLILFGTRESNALLAPIADQLPVELTPHGSRVGATEYSAPASKLGVQLCYPSPFDEKRMIVVQSGLFWGDALPVNHKFDLLPEYIVYTDGVDPSDSTNQALAAGYFDDNWQLSAQKLFGNSAQPIPLPLRERLGEGSANEVRP